MDITGAHANAANAPDQTSSTGVEKPIPHVSDGELGDEEVLEALRNYVPGSDDEKRLVRKMDMTLLPILWWMYILAYLDRGNIVSTNIAE